MLKPAKRFFGFSTIGYPNCLYNAETPMRMRKDNEQKQYDNIL